MHVVIDRHAHRSRSTVGEKRQKDQEESRYGAEQFRRAQTLSGLTHQQEERGEHQQAHDDRDRRGVPRQVNGEDREQHQQREAHRRCQEGAGAHSTQPAGCLTDAENAHARQRGGSDRGEHARRIERA